MRRGGTHHAMGSLAGFLLAAILGGCDTSAYRASHHFPDERWPQKQEATFEFSPARTGDYRPSVWLRHSSNYLYQDFHGLFTITQGHITLWADTIHLNVADSNGKWTGQGLQGLKTITHSLPHSVRLDSACNYQARIRHLMTDDTLPAIKDIGIVLEPQTHNNQ